MRLICELCKGEDFLKQGGVYVCQGCGCKYSPEEAKKMLEGMVRKPEKPAPPIYSPENRQARLREIHQRLGELPGVLENQEDLLQKCQTPQGAGLRAVGIAALVGAVGLLAAALVLPEKMLLLLLALALALGGGGAIYGAYRQKRERQNRAFHIRWRISKLQKEAAFLEREQENLQRKLGQSGTAPKS